MSYVCSSCKNKLPNSIPAIWSEKTWRTVWGKLYVDLDYKSYEYVEEENDSEIDESEVTDVIEYSCPHCCCEFGSLNDMVETVFHDRNDQPIEVGECGILHPGNYMSSSHDQEDGDYFIQVDDIDSSDGAEYPIFVSWQDEDDTEYGEWVAPDQLTMDDGVQRIPKPLSKQDAEAVIFSSGRPAEPDLFDELGLGDTEF